MTGLPSCPSNAMLMSAWVTWTDCCSGMRFPANGRRPERFGLAATAGGLSAAAIHVAVARSGPDDRNAFTAIRSTLRVSRGRQREEPPGPRVDGINEMRLRGVCRGIREAPATWSPIVPGRQERPATRLRADQSRPNANSELARFLQYRDRMRVHARRTAKSRAPCVGRFVSISKAIVRFVALGEELCLPAHG